MNAPVRFMERPERLRLSVENFLLLADSGRFADYGKTELIDGDIYIMNAQLTRHARAKSRLFGQLLLRLRELGSDLEVISEVSVRVADDSMPEPDIVLTRFQGDREMPAASVALVIEVADSTLPTDIGRKAELYAAAGVPEYWVVDLNGKRIMIHAHPDSDGYRRQTDLQFGEFLVSSTIEGLHIETSVLTV